MILHLSLRGGTIVLAVSLAISVLPAAPLMRLVHLRRPAFIERARHPGKARNPLSFSLAGPRRVVGIILAAVVPFISRPRSNGLRDPTRLLLPRMAVADDRHSPLHTRARKRYLAICVCIIRWWRLCSSDFP